MDAARGRKGERSGSEDGGGKDACLMDAEVGGGALGDNKEEGLEFFDLGEGAPVEFVLRDVVIGADAAFNDPALEGGFVGNDGESAVFVADDPFFGGVGEGGESRRGGSRRGFFGPERRVHRRSIVHAGRNL